MKIKSTETRRFYITRNFITKINISRVFIFGDMKTELTKNIYITIKNRLAELSKLNDKNLVDARINKYGENVSLESAGVFVCDESLKSDGYYYGVYYLADEYIPYCIIRIKEDELNDRSMYQEFPEDLTEIFFQYRETLDKYNSSVKKLRFLAQELADIHFYHKIEDISFIDVYFRKRKYKKMQVKRKK